MISHPLFKIFRTLLIYYVCSVLVSFLFALFIKPPVEVLPIFTSSYTVARSFLYFSKILMAVQSSAILMSFAWYLKDFFQESLDLTYALRSKIFKTVFIVLIFTTGVYTVTMEVLEPKMRSSVRTMEGNTFDYYTYVNYAQSFIDWNNYDEARPYVKQALVIYPTSPEALQMERLVDTTSTQEISDLDFSIDRTSQDLEVTDTSFANLLEKARKAYEEESYIDAHYYATLALRAPSSHSIQEARLLAADAWNKIAGSADFSLGEDADLYAKKRQGYEYLLQGDSLASYYVFNDLMQVYPHDPDVVRYFDIASEELHAEHFFIDEVYSARAYETMRNLYFINELPNGNRDIIFISGLSTMADSYGLVQYARDVHVISLDIEQNFLYSFTVDFAKITSVAASHFGTEFIPYFENINSPNSTVPLIQLVSVDRHKKGIMLSPDYKNTPEDFEASRTYTLYMSYDDFALLGDVSNGPYDMSLASVFDFASVAEKYGYSFEVFYQILATRLTAPLGVLLINLLFILLAWRYRLGVTGVVKFWWLILMPICTAICYVVIEIVFYAFQLLMFTFIGFFKWYAIIGFCIALVVMFAITAITFAVQKYE